LVFDMYLLNFTDAPSAKFQKRADRSFPPS